MFRLIAVVLAGSFLGACSETGNTDLQQYVKQTMAKPRGRIEPIPVFKPYEYFSYSAAGLRSPFELPVVVDKSLSGMAGLAGLGFDYYVTHSSMVRMEYVFFGGEDNFSAHTFSIGFRYNFK